MSVVAHLLRILLCQAMNRVMQTKDDHMVTTLSREETGIRKLRNRIKELEAEIDQKEQTNVSLRLKLKEKDASVEVCVRCPCQGVP